MCLGCKLRIITFYNTCVYYVWYSIAMSINVSKYNLFVDTHQNHLNEVILMCNIAIVQNTVRRSTAKGLKSFLNDNLG